MKKPSDEARRRYTEYIQGYKNSIESALNKEKTVKEVIARNPAGAAYQKLTLADENLNIVANYLLMSSLSLSFLGVKNEAFLNEARKCIYKAIIYLEEIVSAYVDAPFSDYEDGAGDHRAPSPTRTGTTSCGRWDSPSIRWRRGTGTTPSGSGPSWTWRGVSRRWRRTCST